MADLTSTLKVAAIRAVIQQVFGFDPVVTTTERYTEFSFTPEQQEVLRKWLDEQITKQPGDIRFNLSPVLIPYIIKKSIPYLLGSAGLGFLVGRK